MATIPVNNKKESKKDAFGFPNHLDLCKKKEEAELFLKKRGLPKDFSK